MARPVSSRPAQGQFFIGMADFSAHFISCLGRVASSLVRLEALDVYTALNVPWQIVPFFTNSDTEEVFFSIPVWRLES
jgi:hypothetical protein